MCNYLFILFVSIEEGRRRVDEVDVWGGDWRELFVFILFNEMMNQLTKELPGECWFSHIILKPSDQGVLELLIRCVSLLHLLVHQLRPFVGLTNKINYCIEFVVIYPPPVPFDFYLKIVFDLVVLITKRGCRGGGWELRWKWRAKSIFFDFGATSSSSSSSLLLF